MLVVVVKNGDTPWSLKGWKINVKQVGETTYGWQLVDPDGLLHRDPSSLNNGFWLQYNIRSAEHLIRSVSIHGNTTRAIEKYLLTKDDVTTIEL